MAERKTWSVNQGQSASRYNKHDKSRITIKKGKSKL